MHVGGSVASLSRLGEQIVFLYSFYHMVKHRLLSKGNRLSKGKMARWVCRSLCNLLL